MPSDIPDKPSPRFFAQISNDRQTILFTFGDDQAAHARAVIKVEQLMPTIDTLAQVAVNLQVELSHAQNKRKPQGLEHVTGSATSFEIVQTSASDCILVVQTSNGKEVRIHIPSPLLDTVKQAVAQLGGGNVQ